jgi:ABC-type Mn2+/Zn2+ transport system ATPase subunit
MLKVDKGGKASSKVCTLQKKLERVGMEKTIDGRKFKLSDHGERMGSIAANQGESNGRVLAAAPLFHKQDPSLRFAFAEGGNLGLHDDMPILQVQGVTFRYPGRDAPTLTDVDLSISRRSRIAIGGANGSGKSTLVNLILGNLEPTSGEVRRHRNARVAYLNQHQADELQRLSCSVIEYMRECYSDKTDLELRSLLGSFGLKDSIVHQALNELSGGQRVRVVFARICAEKPHLLVLDEPSNHLDIYSIDALAEALQTFQGAVVLVSHNCSLLNDVVESLFIMKEKRCCAVPLLAGDEPGERLRQEFSCATKQERSFDDLRPTPNATRCNAASTTALTAPPTTALEDVADKQSLRRRATSMVAIPTPSRATPLRATEKEFLKCAKTVREILKLEALRSSSGIDKTQEKKLQKKEAAVSELASAAEFLPSDSDLLEKHEDIMRLLLAEQNLR